MFIETDSRLVAGAWDLLAIVRDTSTGRYHVYVYFEAPPPGPYDPDLKSVRLKSKMHHTVGAATFDEAVQQLAEARTRIKIADENVWGKVEQVIPLDCSKGFADVIIVPRWKATAQLEMLADSLLGRDRSTVG